MNHWRSLKSWNRMKIIHYILIWRTYKWIKHHLNWIYSIRVHAFATHIFASTSITEFISTSACHVVASRRFFNPKFAARTLLVFCTFDKFLESFIVLIRIFRSLIFLAWLTLMVENSALKAIPLHTLYTCEIIAVYSCFIYKCIIAVCGWTPWNISLGSNCLLKGVILIFFHELRW